MMIRRLPLVLALLVVVSVSGCRGFRSEKPPLHPNPNLDWQAKYKPQTYSGVVPEGTVAWGRKSVLDASADRADFLKADSVFYEGKNRNGSWVKKVPLKVSKELILRGRDRYDIYCSVCHDKAGTGKGMVVKRGFIPPPNLSDARIVNITDGELFDVISNGIRNMPAYDKQIPVEDRWAIVTFVRALQNLEHKQVVK